MRDVLRECYCVFVKTESEEEKSVLLEVLSASSTIWKPSGAKRSPTATRTGRMCVFSWGCTSLAWERDGRVGCQTECRHVSMHSITVLWAATLSSVTSSTTTCIKTLNFLLWHTNFTCSLNLHAAWELTAKLIWLEHAKTMHHYNCVCRKILPCSASKTFYIL